MTANARDTVLVIGSTGSLGKPIVELHRRGVKVRLLGRSHDSFVKAGYSENDFDIIISDLTKPCTMHHISGMSPL